MTGGTAYPLQEQPAYAPVAASVYGTGQDPFNLTLGGYYVSPASLPQFPGEPTHYNAYGERDAICSYRLCWHALRDKLPAYHRLS